MKLEQKSIASMKEREQGECSVDAVFAQGRRICLLLAWAYLVLRIADLLIPWLVFGISPEFSYNMLLSACIAALTFFSGLEGRCKLAGWLCILGCAATLFVLWNTACTYQIALPDLFIYIDTAPCVVIFSLLIAVIGMIFLLHPSIRYYGNRYSELNKELREDITRQNGKMQNVPESVDKQVRRSKHRIRNLIIYLICCTIVAAATIVFIMTDSVVPEYKQLAVAEGELVSWEEIEPAGNYQLTLADDSNSYIISSILSFPGEQYHPVAGDQVALRFEKNEWHNIFELSVNDEIWLGYEQSVAKYHENSLWGLGLVGGIWLFLAAGGLIVYFYRRRNR